MPSIRIDVYWGMLGWEEWHVLELDRLPALADLLRDILYLNDRVRLDDPEEVLLQQCVIERREVCANGRVRRELCTKRCQSRE